MGLLARLLHLGRGRAPAGAAPAPGRLRFVSTREDGLCMRLNTILDAALLAHACDADFAFFWDEAETPVIDLQATASAEAVFTPAFLARHHLPESARRPDAPNIDPIPADAAAFAARIAAGRRAGLIHLDRPTGLAPLRHGPSPLPPHETYAALFDAFGLAAPVRAALGLARAVPVAPGSAAIHIRGGDILHGTHSHMATYLHKAPSLPEIAALIARLAAGGRQVWLVGQEPDMQAALARVFPGLRAFGVTDPHPALDDAAQVLFDAVLMARMESIHGGNSGVTGLSRRLGMPRFTDIAAMPDLVTTAELLSDPMADPAYAGVSANARAHPYVKAVTAVPPGDWGPDHLALLRLAQGYRPGSRFLELLEICLFAATGDPAAAEARARDWLTRPFGPPAVPEFDLAFLLGGAHYFPLVQTAPLCDCADSDAPALALIAALSAAIAAPGASTRAALHAALARAGATLAPRPVDPVMRATIVAAADSALAA